MTPIVNTRFLYYLTYWPSFWPHMTQYQTWPRHHKHEHSDQLPRRSIEKYDLYRSQDFSIIWPIDLVFDPTWLNIELDLDIIKMNILINYQEDTLKNMTPIENTTFFYYLTYWPSFWPHMTQYRIWPRHRDEHPDQLSRRSIEKYDPYRGHKVFLSFDLLT